jgi:hypothetical protein
MTTDLIFKSINLPKLSSLKKVNNIFQTNPLPCQLRENHWNVFNSHTISIYLIKIVVFWVMTLGGFQIWLPVFLRNMLPPFSGQDRNFYPEDRGSRSL